MSAFENVQKALEIAKELFALAPKVVSASQEIFESGKQLWTTVTAEDPPTPGQRKEYDDAEAEVFAALMKSTDDVAEDVKPDGA